MDGRTFPVERTEGIKNVKARMLSPRMGDREQLS